MYRVRQEELPFVGSSHEFVGAEQGDVGVSVFLFSGLPGKGPGPHQHPYDEIQFVREGRGVWTVNGKTFEAQGKLKPGLFLCSGGSLDPCFSLLAFLLGVSTLLVPV